MDRAMNFKLLESFGGFMDIKLGASIITLFAVLNKVAGAYGIIAVFTGGSFAQISMYIYSIATIVVFLWGLKGIGNENATVTLPYAHLFALDHFISTAYTVLFAVVWWVLTPHDGRRIANSDAQKELQAVSGGVASPFRPEDPGERKALAEGVWASERGFAGAVLIGGWFLKIYFIAVLYSFALHLRRGTYRSLPRSRPIPLSVPISNATPQAAAAAAGWSTAGQRGPGSAFSYAHIRTTSNGTVWEGEDVDMDQLHSVSARPSGEGRKSMVQDARNGTANPKVDDGSFAELHGAPGATTASATTVTTTKS